MVTEHSLKVLNLALRRLKPNGGFKHNGTPESVEVIDGSSPVNPQELVEAMAAVEADLLSNAYVEKRAAAYPSFAELADALVKINSGNAQMVADGQTQMAAYVQACLAVKEQFKKG